MTGPKLDKVCQGSLCRPPRAFSASGSEGNVLAINGGDCVERKINFRVPAICLGLLNVGEVAGSQGSTTHEDCTVDHQVLDTLNLDSLSLSRTWWSTVQSSCVV